MAEGGPDVHRILKRISQITNASGTVLCDNIINRESHVMGTVGKRIKIRPVLQPDGEDL